MINCISSKSKKRRQKVQNKPLLKSKEEGQILGLPKDEDKKSDNQSDSEEEPSIYFYEDDDEELENLSK